MVGIPCSLSINVTGIQDHTFYIKREIFNLTSTWLYAAHFPLINISPTVLVNFGWVGTVPQKWLHHMRTTPVMCVFKIHSVIVFADEPSTDGESQVYGLLRAMDW